MLHSEINPQHLVNTYLNYYQSGGAFPVFRGERYQHGSGLGDTMQNIGKFVLPIASTAANSIITSVNESRKEGKSMKQAIKDALLPTLSNTLEKARETISKKTGNGKVGRGGGGRRRIRKNKRSVRNRKRHGYKKRRTPRRGNNSKLIENF